MKNFDQKKFHLVPIIMHDWYQTILNVTNNEVRENYAQRFEATKEFCEYALAVNEQKRQESFKRK